MSHALLVASPGGHIDELRELAERLPPHSRRTWVTAQTPQTESMLAGESVVWVRPIGPRQAARAAASGPRALTLLRALRPTYVLSTGAALAIPYLIAASALRVPLYFVDSATRLQGPSLSGRIAARIPRARLFHQGMTAAPDPWRYVGTVFDGFRAVQKPARAPRRVVVSLGTERFPFSRALSALAESLDEDAEVVWQTGHTTPLAALPGTVRPWVPYVELCEMFAAADVVLTHAGVGSMLTALRFGKAPVIIPRVSSLGEHIDDHQRQLADLVAERGLAIVVAPGTPEAGTPIPAAMQRAAGWSVLRERTSQQPPLPLPVGDDADLASPPQ